MTLTLGEFLYGLRPRPLDALAAAGVHTTSHDGCALTEFCRNPLHPGPCKGWKKNLPLGIQNAVNQAHKEQVVAKRKKTAEAKSAASKKLTQRQLASPLHAKKATIKAANQILGDDDEKASKKAGRVILNKTEIKKYAKIKAAQITALRADIYKTSDESNAKYQAYVESKLADALAKDNTTGKDDEYRSFLTNSATGMAGKVADDLCKEKDGDCDGELYEGLSTALEPAVLHALATGDTGEMNQVKADFKAGKIEPADTGLTALEKEAELGEIFDAVNAGPKFDALADLTKDEFDELDPALHSKIVAWLDEVDGDFSPTTATHKKLVALKKTLDVPPLDPQDAPKPPRSVKPTIKITAMKEVSPEDAAKAAGIEAVKAMMAGKGPKLAGNVIATVGQVEPEDLKAALTPDEFLALKAKVKDAAVAISDPEDKADGNAILKGLEGVADTPAEEPEDPFMAGDWNEPDPFGNTTAGQEDFLGALLDAVDTDKPVGTLAENISPQAKVASDYAHGFKSGTAKQKLAAYEELPPEDFGQMIPSAQKLIMADLDAIKAKFIDPKKKTAAQAVKDKLSPATGGGAGAGGPVDAPNNLAKIMAENTNALMSYVKGPGNHDGSQQAVVSSMFDEDPSPDAVKATAEMFAKGNASLHLIKQLDKLGLDESDLPADLAQDAKNQIADDLLEAMALSMPTPPGLAGKLPAKIAQINQSAEDFEQLLGPGSEAFKAWKVASVQSMLDAELGLPAPASPAGSGGSTTAPNPGVPSVATPPTTVAPSITPAGPVGTGSGLDNISEATQKAILDDLKSMPTGKYLSDPKETTYGNLLALASAHGTPDEPISVLQVLQSVDAAFSKQQGWTNINKWETEFVDWLGTPKGKAFADANPTPDANLVKQFKGEYGGYKTSDDDLAQKVTLPSGPGAFNPDTPASDFKVVTTTEAAKIRTKMHPYSKWTEKERDAVKVYTGSSYHQINGYLRGDIADTTPHYKTAIKDFQGLMRPTPKPLILHRGTGWEQFPPGFRSPAGVKKLLGKGFIDEAFMSTSVGGSAAFGGPVLIELEAPAGTMGTYVENHSSNNGEREFVLAAGNKYHVVSVDDSSSPVRVRLRVITGE